MKDEFFQLFMIWPIIFKKQNGLPAKRRGAAANREYTAHSAGE
jgi:hypothetical protein